MEQAGELIPGITMQAGFVQFNPEVFFPGHLSRFLCSASLQGMFAAPFCYF
jgi:hypothetical protein